MYQSYSYSDVAKMIDHSLLNPTLTVQALAWRTAERLVKSWKSIAE